MSAELSLTGSHRPVSVRQGTKGALLTEPPTIPLGATLDDLRALGSQSPAPAADELTRRLQRALLSLRGPVPAKAPTEAQWPGRLRDSAAHLVDLSLRLQARLDTPEQFAVLTDDLDSGPVAGQAVREFEGLLTAALAALIDLSAYDNPDRAYPDLSQGFEFQCPNAVYGHHTDKRRGH